MPEKLEKMIVGVDLGGSKINSILSDSSGNISRQELKDTLAQEGPDAVDMIYEFFIPIIDNIMSGHWLLRN